MNKVQVAKKMAKLFGIGVLFIPAIFCIGSFLFVAGFSMPSLGKSSTDEKKTKTT